MFNLEWSAKACMNVGSLNACHFSSDSSSLSSATISHSSTDNGKSQAAWNTFKIIILCILHNIATIIIIINLKATGKWKCKRRQWYVQNAIYLLQIDYKEKPHFSCQIILTHLNQDRSAIEVQLFVFSYTEWTKSGWRGYEKGVISRY